MSDFSDDSIEFADFNDSDNNGTSKRCPCNTSNPKSNWPATIMKDNSVCKLNEFLYDDAMKQETLLNAVMKQIVYHTSMFNYVEDIFNSNNEYYYGEIPFFIQKMLYQFIDTYKPLDIPVFKSYIEQEIILPYLNKTYNLDYTNTDFNKIQVLIVFVLMKMSKNNINDIFDKFIKCYIELTLYYNINYLYGNDLYNVDFARNKNDFTQAKINDILAIIVNSFITSECALRKQGTEMFKQCIQDNLNTLQGNEEFNTVMDYLGWNNQTFNVNKLDEHNQVLLKPLQQQFDNLYNECINQCCKAFTHSNLKNIKYNSIFLQISQQNINDTKSLLMKSTTIQNNKLYRNLLENYYYTSMLIYSQFHLPPIKANDDGNGRLSEYMLSNIYYTYAVYLYTGYIIDSDNPLNYDEYNNIYNGSKYLMLNIRKLCTMYIGYFCPDGIFTKRYLNREDPTCKIAFNQGYNIYADVYNKINIDKDYVIVELNDINDINRITKIFKVLDGEEQETDINILRDIITVFKQFVILFAPLRPLVNYYSNMENKNAGRSWFNRNLNIYNDDFNVNNDSGGDLYCAYKDDFFLFDSKRYDDFNKCYKVKTFIQSWMYMNVYWKPLCCVYNNVNNGQNYELYNNYYLGFINPLHNEISACTYDSITVYINDKNNIYKRSDKCKCKYNTYMQNNYKLMQPKSHDKYLGDIEYMQWSIENYNKQRIQKQLQLYGCDKADQLRPLYCSDNNSPICKQYNELIAQECNKNRKHNISTMDELLRPVKQLKRSKPSKQTSQPVKRIMPKRTRQVADNNVNTFTTYIQPSEDDMFYTDEEIEKEIHNRPCTNINRCERMVNELNDMFCKYGTPDSCNKFNTIMNKRCENNDSKFCATYKKFNENSSK